MYNSHSSSTTTCRGFNYNWITNFFYFILNLFLSSNVSIVTRNSGNIKLLHYFFCLNFVSHRSNDSNIWPHKLKPTFLTLFSKISILSKETKTWIYRITITKFCCRYNGSLVKITIFNTSWSNANCIV